MQRSNAVSVEVKRVVGALCSLLAATGLEAVPTPETFRRAKFCGGPEVEDQFWRLLASILQTADVVSCEACARLGGDPRRLVAAGLWQTGYHAGWLRGLEEGGRVSSRELLLALGWLLATGALEKLLKQRVQQLDKTLLTPPPVNSQLANELQLDSASLRKLQWLVGCLRHQGRILLSMQDERTCLLHAVFFASLPSFVSSSDQSSAVLRESCSCMQLLCDLLEAYLNWKKVETVFWTWMDSVADCHLSDPAVEKPTRVPSGSRGVGDRGNRGLEKLEEMLLRLPTGRVCNRQTGPRRGRGGAEDRGGGGGGGGGGGAVQGGSHSPSLPLLSWLPSQVCRARLQAEGPGKHRPAGGPGAAEALPASQAARLLGATEALLLEGREQRRRASRTQLQELLGRLDDLVLIPPHTVQDELMLK